MQGCSRETVVRASIGSLVSLGLAKARMAAAPSTLYLLQYSESGCLAACGFCSQGRLAPSRLRERLSRINWPTIPVGKVVDALSERNPFARICIQSILKPGFFAELRCITELLSRATSTPISVAVTPVAKPLLEELYSAGAERLGVGLDAASPRVARLVGKPYPWSIYMKFIEDSVDAFGDGMVHVHLVAGLGETPREMIETMRLLYRKRARVALFRYTPLPGLPRYPGVSLRLYRFYQVSRLMLERGLDPLNYAVLEPEPRFVHQPPLGVDDFAEALLTSGCPGCNRPFYNESPRGPLFNYPSRRLLEEDPSWRRSLHSIGLDLQGA